MKKLLPFAALTAMLLVSALPSSGADKLRVLIFDNHADSAPGQEGASLLNERNADATALSEFPTEAQLAKADVLVLYAAEPKPLSNANRAALDAFTKRGGGLVVLHGAVAAGDTAWWKSQIGGAWDEGVSRKFESKMMLYVTTDQHPIVHGASPFDLNDETYYDLDVSTNIQVLGSAFTPKGRNAKRAERGAPAQPDSQPVHANIYDLEPQMWTYEAMGDGGKTHRAFVALQGAPATLQHTSFRVFVLRGIAWAAGRADVDEFCTPDDLAALRYPAGGPSKPEQTVAQMDVHPDFKVSVAAAEPLIDKPIAVQWDPSGRLWVAETPEYPNGRRQMVAANWKETSSLMPGVTDRPARDRISILSDPDENGRFTKKTVFYEGLELVTGFCFYRDGVIAIHEPDIVFLRDTDGDGKADKVERLYTGFTPGDTHFVANHFIPAPDGWIYASMGGGQDINSPDGKRSFGHISSGAFRFKPDGSALEQFSSKGGNSFGADVTTDGEVFFGQATSGSPLQHVVMPEQLLARGNLGSPGTAKSVIDQRKVVIPRLPDRVPLMQIDVVGGYSAACAALIYEGGAWPAEYERTAFVTEPILNIIHNEAMIPAGPTFKGEMRRTEAEFIYSHDYWFRPIECALGPDGAVYILDFYSPVIAHSDTRGPQHGRASASVRPDRDHYFGRIYRVQHRQARQLEIPDLLKTDAGGLAKALSHPNRVVRFNAQRLLVEKGGAEVVAALMPVAQSAESPSARLLALWALQRLDALKPEMLRAAFRDTDPYVRKNAALIAETAGATAFQSELARLLGDADARVRLTDMRALAAADVNADTAAALVAAFPKLEDNWSKSAAVAALSGNPAQGISAALSVPDPEPLRPLVEKLAGGLAAQDKPEAVPGLVARLAAAPASADPLKRALLERLAAAKTGEATPELIAALRTLLASPNPEVSAAALQMAAAWDKSGALSADTDKLITPLLAQVENKGLADERREQLVTVLAGARKARADILPAIAKLLTGQDSDDLKLHVISALRATGDPAVGAVFVSAYPQLAPAVQRAAFDALLTRADWADDLLDALEKKQIAFSLLGTDNAFRLRMHPSHEVSVRAVKFLNSLSQPSPDKDALIAKFIPAVAQPGNIAKGKALFTANCAVCHKFGDFGADVGPVLTGMGAHGPETLLVHILDPNRQVDAGFEAWNIETKDGEFHSGIIAQENATRVLMRMPGQQVEIAKADIKSRVNTGRSLMPEGFEALGGESLRDIIAFLIGEAPRFRVLDLSAAYTADTRHGLYGSRDALDQTLHFKRFGIVNVEGVPFNLVDPAKSTLGGNLIVLKGGDRNSFARTLPQIVEVPVGLPARRIHFLGGVAGWGAGSAQEGGAIMTATLVFADGQKSSVSFRNGVHFSDYVREVDVPGSKFAPGVVQDKQIRWFTIEVPRKAVVEKLILESAGSGPAPTTAAITADLSDAPLPESTAPLKWEAGAKVLVVGGGSSHDFSRWFNSADAATLRAAGGLSVNYTESSATATRELPNVDVLVSSTNQKGFDTPEFRQALIDFANAGKGLVLVHPAVWYNWGSWPEYNKTFVGGGAHGHDPIAEFEVTVLKEHPVTKGLPPSFKITDELYHSTPDPAGASIEVLAQTSTARTTKKQHPSVWIVNHPKARIVCIALGHDGRAHDLPEYKQLLVNAVKWTAEK